MINRRARRKTVAAAEMVEVFEGIPSFVTLPAHPKILFASQTVSVCIPDQPRQVRTIWIVIFVSRCSEKL